MAEAIRKIKRMDVPEEKIREDNVEDVVRKVSDNKDAILNGIDILATLHEQGMLDLLHALIKRKDDALENILTELNKPQYAESLKNIGQLVFLLGDIKLDEIQYFTDKINQGMAEASAVETDEITSYVALFKALKEPEINRSVTMLLHFLRGMGK
ncbi:MAG TPA: DUF1641 domain-containing protein [Bacillota bacterium]|nr:DUF1641 domain-containing protein [Bacillota bacterium]